jgi:hypothetical protein
MKYRATFHPHDLHRAQSLLREEGFPAVQWRWPVVIAEDGRRLRAVVGTRWEHGLVVGGPMVIDRELRGRAPLVAYRLGRFYDKVMAGVGVRRYYIDVENRLSQFKYILKRLGFEEDCDDGAGGTWFLKTAGRWGQVRVSDHERPINGLKQRVE